VSTFDIFDLLSFFAILYSQLYTSWHRIKRDFLSHFANPRLDLLAWVIVMKLQPQYVRIAQKTQYLTGRPRDARAWRKSFKADWKACYARDTPKTSSPISDTTPTLSSGFVGVLLFVEVDS
jgi:hypothetical protein